ncbi:MAG: hypothetical protein QNI89_02425 [Desulfobacterales bacterium]|nr:hypothetical protein [Desulfobacterales bacterium]MDJ0804299.1 hypothetical protein [Desulfobacterales bacterium]MDJ0853880.1 hypothetical protein [Desulfobacterales bacterium]MDJ0886123.1 hypothetical protein [Desulfobacterales bacterium]
MLQKFVISHDKSRNRFAIREMAVIDKNLGNKDPSRLRDEDYAFLCEESYSGSKISASIDRGLDDLVATLRTPNFFPIRTYAVKIAESVMALHDSDDRRRTALVFDDRDLMATDTVQ